METVRFEWKDNFEIGHHELTLYDDDNKKLDDIYFTDYTCEYRQEDDRKHKHYRPYSFEVGYCHGWSMKQGFDEDNQYRNHLNENGRAVGGYQGNCTHTIDDVKRWCEEFLASLYIINYEEELKKLQKRLKRSQWFIDNGYTGKYEGME